MLILILPDLTDTYISKINLDQIFWLLKSWKMNKKSDHQDALYQSMWNMFGVDLF